MSNENKPFKYDPVVECIWERMEQHINDNLGYYGLEFMDKFLDLKESAEDIYLCPPDTPERQDKFAEQNG
jgi:hypothetical protein